MYVLLALAMLSAPDGLERGIDLYSRLKYERALTVLTQALENPSVDREQAYMYIGLSRMQLGDELGARAAFREVLALDAKARLPGHVSPKIAAVFDDEASRARANVLVTRPVEAPEPASAITTTTMTAPIVPPAERGVGDKLTRWPVLIAGGVTVLALGTGTFFGIRSSGRDNDARDATFASEAHRLHQGAVADAHRANAAFITAGVVAAFGLTYGFAF